MITMMMFLRRWEKWERKERTTSANNEDEERWHVLNTMLCEKSMDKLKLFLKSFSYTISI